MRDFKEGIKGIKKTALFLLLFGLMLTGTSGWITEASRKDDSLIQGRNKNIVNIQKEPENTIDVLFLGDSLGYTSFSPLQMWEEKGFTSFAGCQSSQKIQESYYMLKTTLEKQKPKVVVMETNVIFRDQKGMDGIRDTIGEKFNYYLPLFRFHDIWKPILMGKQYTEDNFKGFMIRKSVAAYSGKPYMGTGTGKREITDVVRFYLDEIQKLCEDCGAEFLLVSIPSPKNYNSVKHNALTEYAEEKNLKYIDLNMKTEELGIDWQNDSLDGGDHPNLSGAKKISAFVETYLKEHYDLPDHRGDPAYSGWDSERTKYDSKVSQAGA